MQYFVNILSEITFTQQPLKNPPINSFIHWEKFRGENVFLISRILLQFEESDPMVNSSMQQPRKRFPVIRCATYLEPALLVDRLVCYFITHFLKSIREKSKALKNHIHKCLNVRERVDVVEWNKERSPPFSCRPVNCQCLWKKTLIEKKKKNHTRTLLTECHC